MFYIYTCTTCANCQLAATNIVLYGLVILEAYIMALMAEAECLQNRFGKKAGNSHISQDGGKYWYLPGNTGK